jgi:hypothetical protein
MGQGATAPQLRRLILVSALLAGCASAPAPVARKPSPPPPPPPPVVESVDAGSAMRQLLEISGQRSVAQLAKREAIWNDPGLRIPLPRMMERASRYLTMRGYSQELQTFHKSINHAAELAIADFGGPLSDVTLAVQWPAGGRVAGGDVAATAYLRNQAGETVRRQLGPLVDLALRQTQANREYEALILGAGDLGAFLAGPRDDLSAFVADRAVSALFKTMGRQEARLRRDSDGGGVDILRRWYQQNARAAASP